MVTGSHIPDDRNGIKFNTPRGEVTKSDEAGVRGKTVTLPDVFDEDGMLKEGAAAPLGGAAGEAAAAYHERFMLAFPEGCLRGMHLGLYGHSAVGRDVLVKIYEALGARVTRLGYSETFIPVDTEAIRPEDSALAAQWAAEYRVRQEPLDAILSTDGDSDRPLISDENGLFLRGDVAGILASRFLGADAVATPVSCNTALEKTGLFPVIERTKIGSPFVIAGMESAVAAGAQKVVGYEANGGFLTQSEFEIAGGGALPALPTRDAVIVHLTLLLAARAAKKPLSGLAAELPSRYTASDRDQAFAQDRSQALLERISNLSDTEKAEAFNLGAVTQLDQTDGLRMTFEGGAIVHLRPSGNAPELRCYAEADTPEEATRLVEHGLSVARLLAPAT
jgi:phosphomannomutase